MGYAGGTTKNPTYHRLGDHSETIQIDYDPTQVSYEKLLDIFWDSHDPTRQSWSRQYMSIIFYHNEEQKGLAIETKDREEATKGKISTEVIPASEFYLAEPYHQKYRLQQVPDLIKDFSVIYPALDDFINSTAAARVNGYVGGYGTLATLEEEINSLGLSPTAEEKLREIAKRNQ